MDARVKPGHDGGERPSSWGASNASLEGRRR